MNQPSPTEPTTHRLAGEYLVAVERSKRGWAVHDKGVTKLELGSELAGSRFYLVAGR